ncbi:MAG: U32 family peptidase [Erysipelotrichaceae bacterium]
MKCFSILRSFNQLAALHEAGADGILLGIEGLSYRMANYPFETAITIRQEAVSLGLDVFLFLNRLLDEDEIDEVKVFLKKHDLSCFDGIYFQDLAYVELLKDIDIPLIYAPEAIITSSQEVASLVSCGIDRVLIAKELTLEEAEQISRNNPFRVELFGFGHLPMSVSRRPLVRNYLEEIKADMHLSQGTGLRLKEAKRSVYFPVFEDAKETVIFADTIFCLLNELCELETNGVYSIIADDLFVDETLLTEFIASCRKVLGGADPKIETQRLERLAKGFTLSSGYFYKKTNLTKEGTTI